MQCPKLSTLRSGSELVIHLGGAECLSRVMNRHGLLFDHLVGAGEERRWNCDAERVSGLKIDEEFELCRLLYGEFSGRGAL